MRSTFRVELEQQKAGIRAPGHESVVAGRVLSAEGKGMAGFFMRGNSAQWRPASE
jgi:hypothetical protein